MDKPEDVHCFNCGAHVGYLEQGDLIWTCSRCEKKTQLNKRGQPVEATPALQHVAWKLHDLDRDFRERQQKYRVYIPGSRGGSGKAFDPSPDAVGVSWLGPAVLAGLGGMALLVAGQPLPAVGLCVIGAAAAVFIKKANEDNARTYYKLEEDRKRERVHLEEEARRLVASTE